MKYLITLILCLILPVLLFAQERTVQVGDTKATIKVEEGKTELETKPPEGTDVLIIPFDKFSEYGITPLTVEEVMAQYSEDVEEEKTLTGTFQRDLIATYATIGNIRHVFVIAVTRFVNATQAPHFMDLWFNWRYNKLRFDHIHTGAMGQSYRYDPQHAGSTYDITTQWAFQYPVGYNYLFRFASGHAGLEANSTDLWDPTLKTNKKCYLNDDVQQ